LSARKLAVLAVAALLAPMLSALPGHAACDPTTDPDKTDIANARAAVVANCNCTGELRHGAYVSCAAQQANAVLTNKSCAGFVKKCAAHSTCGKPNAVTCCLTTTKVTKCKIKPDAPHCTAKGGSVGSCTSCCDACPASGSGPSCPTPTTTTTLPSCSAPNACGGSCPTGTTCLYDFNRNQCFCDNCGAGGSSGCVCLLSNPPPSCDAGHTCSASDTCVMDVCGLGPNWCFGPTCTSDTDCTGGEVCTFVACCGAPGASCGPNFHCCSGTCSGGICSSPSGAFLDG
jgi:hypothetical protein